MAFIRVEVNKKRQFVKFDDVENVSTMDFVRAVLKTFSLKDVLGSIVYIYDSLDTCIETDEVLQHVLRMRNSADFYLKVDFVRPNQTPTNDAILSTDIESYVDSHRGKDILSAFRSNGCLSDSLRRKLVNIILDLLIERYGLYPSKEQKTEIAKATVNLFTCFKMNTSIFDGIDLFYNPVVGDGWLSTGLKTRRKNSKNNENIDPNRSLANGRSIDDVKADFEFLRSAVINEQNMDLIKEKLALTLEFRRALFDDTNIKLLQDFPYFFHHPVLVLCDFDYLFKQKEIGNFLSVWSTFKINIKNVLEQHDLDKDFATVFAPDVEEILALLKLLPNKQCGKGTANVRLPFPDAISRLIVFVKSGSPPWNGLKKDQTQPYIIAFGPTAKEINAYFIVVEENLINVPRDFSFVQTFDLFFKLHHVLNFDFDTQISTMMNFIQHFVYKIVVKKFKPTTHMKHIFNDLSAVQ